MSESDENERPHLTIVPSTEAASTSTGTELVDEPTLAMRLGVSRSTLQSWRYAGRGPRFLKLGRLVRYRTADVDEYLRANVHGPNVA